MIRPATTSEVDHWDSMLAEVAEHPHFLQTRLWGETKQASVWSVQYLIAELEGIRLPLLMLTRPLPPTGRLLSYLPKGPVLTRNGGLSTGGVDALIRDLQAFSRENKALLLKLEPEVHAGDAWEAALSQHGFQSAATHPQFKHTMWLNLEQDEEALINSFKSKTRYNIRLAERKGVAIDDAQTPENLRAFYELYQETGRRQHFPVRSQVYYERLWQAQLAEGRGRLLLARHEGDLLGGVYLLRFADRVYYQYGASSETKRSLMAPYLLQWAAMQWGRSVGATVYDMVGLPEEPDPADPFYGVWKFKQGFQGETVRFTGAWDWSPTPLVQKAWPQLERAYKRLFWYFGHDTLY